MVVESISRPASDTFLEQDVDSRAVLRNLYRFLCLAISKYRALQGAALAYL
jgi:hypothetical protein